LGQLAVVALDQLPVCWRHLSGAGEEELAGLLPLDRLPQLELELLHPLDDGGLDVLQLLPVGVHPLVIQTGKLGDSAIQIFGTHAQFRKLSPQLASFLQALCGLGAKLTNCLRIGRTGPRAPVGPTGAGTAEPQPAGTIAEAPPGFAVLVSLPRSLPSAPALA